MSPLGQFMNQLLKHHKGDVQIIDDNAKLTTQQKRASLQQSRDSLQSSSMHSSNHSNTRWEMDGSNHSTEVRHSISALNCLSSVPTAPIRKPSNDPPEGMSQSKSRALDISSHKAEKRVEKYLGKHSKHFTLPTPVPSINPNVVFSPTFTRKPWNQGSNTSLKGKRSITKSMNDIFASDPATAPNTPEPSPVASQPNPVVSVNLIKPSRKLSPMQEETPFRPPLSLELNRSLSKTLIGVDEDPQAPKIPTRRPSKQPDLNSPVSNTCAKSSSKEAYSQLVENISLSPLDVGRKNSPEKLILAQQAQEMANSLQAEPPLSNNNPIKRGVFFPKPSSKWLGALGKRN